jgi:hypothetical protein
MHKRSAWIVVILLLFVNVLCAQSDRGSLTGTVTDTTGAVLPDTSVVATNTATGVIWTAKTNQQGLYSILNLPLGTYSVTFKKDGFKTVDRSSITISTAQVAEVNISLGVGSASDTVMVTDDAPVLETQTVDLGTNMKGDVVSALPLNAGGGRQIENFAFAITPGVEGNGWTAVISGTQNFTKEVVIDGTTQNSSIQGDVMEATPTMEAVREVQAQTSGMDTERGVTNGGVINFGIKSGTNKFHGSAFGFGHNEILDANTWANGQQHLPKPKSRFWDYGFSAGGPIIKNKTFVFGAFERYQAKDFRMGSTGDSSAATVPTAAMLNGDFSALLGGPIGATDACGAQVLSGAIFDPATGCQFQGNKIDPSRFSSASKQIIGIYQKYYAPVGSGLIQNLPSPSSNTPSQTPNEITIKVDHNLSDKNRLSGSWIYNHRPRTLNDSGGLWAPGSTDGGPLSLARTQRVISNSWRIADEQTISPTLINVFNFTYNEYLNGSIPSELGTNWNDKLGFGKTGADNFPAISFGPAVDGYSTTQIGNSWQGHWVAGNYVWGDTMTLVKGRHTIKFGGEWRAMQMNSKAGDGTLHFSFTNDLTGAPGTPYHDQVGAGFASFLLGGVQSASQDTPFNLYGRRKNLSLFVQDTFKVNSRLTINGGLRYQINNPLHEKYGHWANFDMTAMNPTLGVPGVMEFAKSGSDSFEKVRDWLDFGPQVGFAYALTQKLVLRGAYGLYYAPIGINYWNGIPYGFAPGYRGTNEVKSAFNWDSGYPGVFQPGTQDPNSYPWSTVSVDPRALRAGYSEQMNFGVQYELAKDTRLSVGYVGNRSHRLHDGSLANTRADVNSVLNLCAPCTPTNMGHMFDWIFSASDAAAAGVPYPYAGWWGQAINAIDPFPQLSVNEYYGAGLYVVDSPLGNSAYNSLQVELTKRTSHGLSSNFSYVFSKATGNTSSAFGESSYYSFIQNAANLKQAADSLNSYDMKHVFKGYLTYELPFGKGKKFLSGSNGFANAVAGGWTLGTVLRYNSGQPLWITGVKNPYWPEVSYIYPIFAPGAHTTGNHLGQLAFDPSLITDPAPGTLGNGPMFFDALRGPGKSYEDASALKDFSLGAEGRYKLQLRFEFYNIFNRHYLANPVTNLSNPDFGRINGVTNDAPRQGQFGARFEW